MILFLFLFGNNVIVGLKNKNVGRSVSSLRTSSIIWAQLESLIPANKTLSSIHVLIGRDTKNNILIDRA